MVAKPILVSAELHKRLKVLAAQKGLTIKALCEKILAAYERNNES